MQKIQVIILVLFLTLTSCRSKDGDFNVFSEEDDVTMGAQFNQMIKSDTEKFPILSRKNYPEAYKYLEQITSSILKSDKVLYKDEFPWEVYIIDDDSVLNAFCTPGGYIYVYTGLIRFLESEDQLAGVLGHEIAHADLRHSTEQLTKNYGVRILINVIAGDASALGDVAGNLLSLNFSRSDESEADMKSVEYLAGTEYDARGVARFFEKMENQDGNHAHQRELSFLSTHPSPENRITAIFSKWKELGSPQGKTFKERYQLLKKALP